jgi:hypothetical protein
MSAGGDRGLDRRLEGPIDVEPILYPSVRQAYGPWIAARGP